MRGCSVLLLILVQQVSCLPPNFEDLELSIDQPVGEVVKISQQDPQSNAIHIGHNNPKDSDISVEQINPFNTTVHISLNVGSGSKVSVKMQNARNLQLHISFNGMSNSECTVEIMKAFNSTVHLSFQNPVSTPVTVNMDEAIISSLHVSQNIPRNSPMMVTMENPKDSQIHLSQAVPMSSPLTWKLNGDPDLNQIEVSQNAADSNSPLDCTPECPQEEYVYDYQYAGSAQTDVELETVDVEDPVEEFDEESENDGIILIEDYQVTIEEEDINDSNSGNNSDFPESNSGSVSDYPEVPETGFHVENEIPALPPVQSEVSDSDEVGGGGCPGDTLESCVDICPGEYGPRVYGACVSSCGRRCP